MSTHLFDSTFVSNAQEAVDFIGNILESSTEYSIIGLDFEGKIILWNEGARRLYGYEPGEVFGNANASILLPLEDVSAGLLRQMTDIVAQTGKWEGTVNHVRKNGETFMARVVLTARRDIQGKLGGYLLI